jgi:type I restriction enzyme S subunit
VKVGWIEKSLGEICSISRGGSPRPIQAFLTSESDGINWVKISDATASGKYIYETAEKIKPSGAARSRMVKDGDFLLSNSMSFGRPYIMRTTGCVHDGWLVLSEYQESFNQDFLYHLLGSPQVFSQFDRLAAGSTVRNLNIELASKVIVPIPTLKEQRRLVTLLDEAFTDIATVKVNAEKNLQNARGLFASRMQTLFDEDQSWERIQLEELLSRGWIESHLDGNHGSDYPRKEEFVESGVPYIAARALRGWEVDFSEAKYLTHERAATIRKGLAQDGDVLFAHNATVGPVGILKTNEPFVILGTSLTYYRCNENLILPEYLAHYMRSPAFVDQYSQVMKQSTRNQVPITKQREFFHVIPPLSMQQKIANDLDRLSEKIELLESIYRQKLTALDDLKKSLLHQAFSGQL